MPPWPLAGWSRSRPAKWRRRSQAVRPLPEGVERMEVAGPGFINFFLSSAALAKRLEAIQGDERFGVPAVGSGRSVVIDYSSPNVAKPMHIGHIRSTVIGNALDRLHRFLGFRVIADNHLGDWGTQFGILIMGYRNFRNATRGAGGRSDRRTGADLVKSYQRRLRCRIRRSVEECARAGTGQAAAGRRGEPALWKQFVELSSPGSSSEIYQTARRVVRCHAWARAIYNHTPVRGGGKLLASGVRARPSEPSASSPTGNCRQGRSVPSSSGTANGLTIPASCSKSDGGFNYATTDLATLAQPRGECSSPRRSST